MKIYIGRGSIDVFDEASSIYMAEYVLFLIHDDEFSEDGVGNEDAFFCEMAFFSDNFHVAIFLLFCCHLFGKIREPCSEFIAYVLKINSVACP